MLHVPDRDTKLLGNLEHVTALVLHVESSPRIRTDELRLSDYQRVVTSVELICLHSRDGYRARWTVGLVTTKQFPAGERKRPEHHGPGRPASGNKRQ